MGKYHQRGPGNSLLSSKWFVVAACGAIAMVLGAMSVGARTGPHRDPTNDYPAPMAANQAVYLTQAGPATSSTLAEPSEQPALAYTPYQQRTATPSKESSKDSSSLQVGPIKGVNLSLPLAPLTATVTITSSEILPTPLETPSVTEPTPSDAADTPLQGATATPVEPSDTADDPSTSTETAAQ